MKYLCLVYHEEGRIAALPRAEWDALVAENLALCEELRRSGHFVSAAPLDSVTTAATVRVRQGRPSTTDGPFAETKEQLGGILFLEADDLDHAVRLMSKHPGVKAGPFEIRPAEDLTGFIRESEARRRATAKSSR